MKSFSYAGMKVEVEDKGQLEKIEEILAQESYTLAALTQAAPGMMRAIATELRTCTDRKVLPDKLIVRSGKVKAELKPDRRANKDGTVIGNL